MRKLLMAFAVLALLMSPALAHNGSWTESMDTMGQILLGHDDAYDWKGWAELTVTNTSLSNWWGDFHFEIYEPTTYTNVIISDAEVPQMLNDLGEDYLDGIAPSEYTYAFDGDQKLDFFFYDAPVGPGETVTFKVYTDNTVDENAWFGLIVYPTPVPEPATLTLLCLGALSMAIRKRR